MAEHRETLEEFLGQLDSELEFIPAADSAPISEALAKAKRILEGSEWITQLDRNWIEALKYQAIKYLPQSSDVANLYILANELAQAGLPRGAEILRAISYGMAYQARLGKHYESTNDETTPGK